LVSPRFGTRLSGLGTSSRPSEETAND
jgi:hypothetical protein